jgi:hypothetical protein
MLLTGAGFSKDFGGFLRKEMWEKIFNTRLLKENFPRINELANNVLDYDYESIYSGAHGSFTKEENNAINKVFLKAYRELDESIRSVFWRDDVPRDVRELIQRFSRQWGGGEYFFTLNQDLLIERLFFQEIHIPGFNAGNRISVIREKEFSEEYTYMVPNDPWKQEPLTAAPLKLHYIKLHGSFNWINSENYPRMVIGKNKWGQIASEPLLDFYFNIFKEELSQKSVRLLVIGYSFLDGHINEVMARSDVELHVIDPLKFERFKEYLGGKPYGNEIVKKIGRGYYYPYSLKEIFSQVGIDSHPWKTIKESFFVQE